MFEELDLLKIFFENPSKEFSVRESARLLKKSPSTVSTKLKFFSKANILKYRKERFIDLYSSNIDSLAYRDLKIYYSITKIRESKLITALNDFYIKPVIVLFGSFSKGYDSEDSNIDLFIVSEKTQLFSDLKIYEKKLGKSIHLFVNKKLSDIKNLNLKNSIINGIVLQGEIKWI